MLLEETYSWKDRNEGKTMKKTKQLLDDLKEMKGYRKLKEGPFFVHCGELPLKEAVDQS
jgi:hypothetical protein